MKKFLNISAILIVGFIGYIIGAYHQPEQALSTADSIKSEEPIDQSIPECDMGRCPVYESADVDGDTLAESIVYQPIGMTKGVAAVLIINDEKIVFSRGGAQLSYEIDESESISITTVEEFDETGINPKTTVTEKWEFMDGEYVLVDSKK